MSGKGDAPRNCYSEKFRDGWERAFASPSGDGGDKEIDGKNALEWCGSNYGTAQLTEDAGGDISIVQPEDVGNLSFVKIDVEGFEPEVLLVLSDAIRKYRPRMLIEQRVADGNLDAVSSFLDDLNYNYYPIQGEIGKQCDLYCEPKGDCEPNGDREQACDQPLSGQASDK